MATDYDTAGKQLFDRHARDWLALLGWPLPPTDAGVSVVDSDVSTVARAADKLVRVDGVPVPYVAHVEFQSAGTATWTIGFSSTTCWPVAGTGCRCGARRSSTSWAEMLGD